MIVYCLKKNNVFDPSICNGELSHLILKFLLALIPFKATKFTWYFSRQFDNGDKFCDLMFAFLQSSPF